MDCEYVPTGTANQYQCQHCAHVRTSQYPPHMIHRMCPARPDHRDTTCPPGCQLSRLLQSLGQTYTPNCGCSSEAAKMDAGTTTPEETLAVMRAEAEKRGLLFVERQARWLIELAHTLAADQREPNRLERIRLRAMRIGNRLING